MGDQGGSIDMQALKRTKLALLRDVRILIALASLLVLLACQLLNPSAAPSSVSQQSPTSSFNFPLALRWQQHLDCRSVFPPQAWGETFVVPYYWCPNSGLYALDVKSGDILWQRGGGDLPVTNSPGSRLSQGGKLIVGTDEGVQALDLRTGESLWSMPSFTQVFHLVYGEGKVFAQVEPSIFSTYDLETGQMLWQNGVDQRSAIYYDARNQSLVTVPSANVGNHYWLDPDSGEILRIKPMALRSQAMTTALVENGKLYYGAFVIDAATATPVCIHPEYAGSFNPGDLAYDLPLLDDVVYISTSSSVVAFDTIACQPKWEYQPQRGGRWRRSEVVSNPAILNGVVYAIFSDATLRAIDQQSGQEIGYWQAEAVKYSRGDDSAVPGVVVSGDTLIASFGNGQITAFGP
jgi:outer membrane protein assembly factor BamB